jgi:hypothetical protein
MSNKKKVVQKKGNKSIFIVMGVIIAVVALTFIIKGGLGEKETTASSRGDLIIPKSGVSEKATFYPYKVGKTKMEVLALKASDGTIRTAFNTCQVCYDSGRGYYEQEGDVLVCQNCGNRFKSDQVEKEKGGCNPVPIFDESKTDDGTNIIISKDILEANSALFGNWNKK